MSAGDQALLEDREGPLLRLTINRPEKRNALALTLLEELGQCLAARAADDSIHCVILTGAGDRAFAAGGDLRELDAIRDAPAARAMSRLGRTALDQIRNFPVPVVAALNGPALGGGAELALACDLRVADAHADLGFLQAQLSLTTAWGGGIDLLAAVGPARALELLLQGRRVAPAEALALGLVQRVCGPGENLAALLADFVAPLLERPVPVLRACKALSNGARLALHQGLAASEEASFVGNWLADAHWEAAARALAPRPSRPAQG